jgi:hypothetical protein
MPEMDGYEVAKRLRAGNPQRKNKLRAGYGLFCAAAVANAGYLSTPGLFHCGLVLRSPARGPCSRKRSNND